MTKRFRSMTAAAALLLAVPALAANQHPGAEAFAEQLAAEQGLDAAWVREVLARAEYRPNIIEAITRPAEAKPWHEYRQIFIKPDRIEQGVEFWQEHRALLESIEAEFGVPIEIVLAIIGVETRYGRITGSHRVLDALVTLGFYYPRRGTFFSRELAEFFRLSREENLPLEEITGSYAGAMGIGQFIPSSYRAYAVDFDKSGDRDLWRSLPDALASVANYLAVHGWRADEPAALPARADTAPSGNFPVKPQHTIGQLAAIDLHFDRGGLAADTPATVIELDGADGPEHWIGLTNFYVITRYNRSPLYAMAVHQLAGEIRRARDRSSDVDPEPAP
ncbi:MAG: lytic murein transglycosylase B [Wenzhouxiangellaceae bacterium]|nr:lytic murein transglycosylase B [Wenzhouxiangellaceae bacterium]